MKPAVVGRPIPGWAVAALNSELYYNLFQFPSLFIFYLKLPVEMSGNKQLFSPEII